MTQTNVKKGDLAIVVRRSRDNPHTHGLVVRVLRRKRLCKLLKGTPWYVNWHIAAASGRPIVVNGTECMTCTCPDLALRRINEGDGPSHEAPVSPALELVAA